MGYKTYPCKVKFKYLVRRNLSVVAGFFSEKDVTDYALSIGGTVIQADKNPRNAGRIPKFSDREKDAIRERISQGIPVRRIAEEFRCSVGYVQKINVNILYKGQKT